MHNLSLAQLAKGLTEKKFSSTELVEYFYNRIETLDSKYNSFITLTKEPAKQAAQNADKLLSTNNATPLTGLPIAHKDIFCTQGIKTTCGSKILSNFISPYDGTMVHQLKQAGMVMLGKTNMDEFAMGSSNETSFYGPVYNPWDTTCVPGGSSGGSAASVAARLTPAATGTDTGGSIRQPAALCGITGMKPTYGRISRYGMVAFASSLDQAGPMARTAEDCAMLLNAMAGFDLKDSTSIDKPVPDYTKTLNDSIKGKTIGLPKEYFGEGLSPNVQNSIQEAIQQLEKLGAKVIDITLPNSHLSVPVYYVIAPAECSSNLSRFDGMRYGHRCESPKDLTDCYKRSRGEGFGQEVKRRIIIGTYTLSAGYYDAYYLKAQKVRHLISDDFKAAFENVDIIAGPTTPTPAFKVGEKSDDPVSMYLSDIYTIATNLAGLPGISIPAGLVDNKPCGLQLIGNYFQEAALLNVAHQFQTITDWHNLAPEGIELT